MSDSRAKIPPGVNEGVRSGILAALAQDLELRGDARPGAWRSPAWWASRERSGAAAARPEPAHRRSGGIVESIRCGCVGTRMRGSFRSAG
jgi:hypothetical protein